MNVDQFLREHRALSRRYFIGQGVAGLMAASVLSRTVKGQRRREEQLAALETWLTRPDDFGDVSRGDPRPHSLSLEKRKQVGLTRDTWKLEVISDPDNPAKIRSPLSQQGNSALDFGKLMEMAKSSAVRFPKS